MKHIFELRMKDQKEERSSQLVRNLSSCEKKTWKKIQAWTGCEPMTSAMPVQCSTNWAIKPTGSWSYCEFVIYPCFTSNPSGPGKSSVALLPTLLLHHSVIQFQQNKWPQGVAVLPWSLSKHKAHFMPEVRVKLAEVWLPYGTACSNDLPDLQC